MPKQSVKQVRQSVKGLVAEHLDTFEILTEEEEYCPYNGPNYYQIWIDLKGKFDYRVIQDAIWEWYRQDSELYCYGED